MPQSCVSKTAITTPYDNSSLGKKEQIALMFNRIAKTYDFLNHFLSFGIDIVWRKKAIQLIQKEQYNNPYILDIATGTADLAMEALALNPAKITGIDISEKMLEIASRKIKQKELDNRINLLLASAENLPFSNNTFDIITVGFGIRNTENLEKSLSEMYRVLKENGLAVILEFSHPPMYVVRIFYNIYFNFILPFIGKIISRDYKAYSYLTQSVKAFPEGESFINIYKKSGFKNIRHIPLTFGIASLYIGKK